MERELNEQQKEAVTYVNGPLLIIAGAGTGKTTVITERIKWLLEQKLAQPEEILALTFTEKAAKEMEERVDQALPYGVFGLWVGTFHSFCDRILRSEALQIGLNPSYQLLTEAQAHLLVKKNFWQFPLHYFRPQGNPYKFIGGLIQHFSRLKDEDITPQQYLEFANNFSSKDKDQKTKVSKEFPGEEEREMYRELAEAYQIYENLKISEGVMDFADLIANVLKLFRERQAILLRYRKQFKYILIDEFQDTNYAQYQLVKLLAPDDSNLTVVGDDSQSIYKFRGAAVSNILNFMRDYPHAKQVVLTQNYRSAQVILDAAYRLVKHNDPDTLEAKLGISKNLVSLVGKEGLVCLLRAKDAEREAELVAGTIKRLGQDEGYMWSDIAILVRANNHADWFVHALERLGIPYQFLGPGKLFNQPEVKDLIAYLRFLADFTDNLSLYRVLSMEIFRFRQRDLIEVINKAKKANCSLFEQLEKEEAFADFVAMVYRHQNLLPKETGGQILYYFLEDSGILRSIINWEEKKAQNIAAFFEKVKSWEMTTRDSNVFGLVDYLNLAMNLGESPLAAEIDWTKENAVNILTVHSAKGLEFPVVFLVNLVEGRFPTYERRDQIPIHDDLVKELLPVGDYHLEEERRLFYVGMTRAKEKLFFSAADFYGEGKRERKLSRFVSEAGVEEKGENLNVEAIPAVPMNFYGYFSPGNKPIVDRAKLFKIDSLSYSAIQTFKECPLHFKLRYILNIPTPLTAPLAFGNSLHAALREFYQQIVAGQVRPDRHEEESLLLRLLEKNWLSEGYFSKKHEQESWQRAQKFLQGYLSADLHRKANPIYLELPFTFRVDKTLKITGKIDRIDELADGVIEIIDYKSGANVPTLKEIDLDLQMTIYALAAVEVLNKHLEKVRLSFYFLEAGQRITTTRTWQQLEEAKKDLLAIRNEIERSDFSCSRSRICENCEFKLFCS